MLTLKFVVEVVLRVSSLMGFICVKALQLKLCSCYIILFNLGRQ